MNTRAVLVPDEIKMHMGMTAKIGTADLTILRALFDRRVLINMQLRHVMRAQNPLLTVRPVADAHPAIVVITLR